MESLPSKVFIVNTTLFASILQAKKHVEIYSKINFKLK